MHGGGGEAVLRDFFGRNSGKVRLSAFEPVFVRSRTFNICLF